MTKSELLSTYTKEQLVYRYLSLQEEFNKYKELMRETIEELPEELKQGIEFYLEIDRLQSEVEKYRKAFEDAKKERDCQIAEYQNKIEELENKNISDFLPEDPIKVADILINAMHEPCARVLSFGKPYSIYDISELRQIAEHLLVYCNHHREVEE